MNEHPLFNEQLALEEEMRTLGIERYWKQVNEAKEEGRESATVPAKRLAGHAHLKMRAALEQFLADCASAKPGRRASAYTTLKDIDVDLATHLTIRAVLDTVSGVKSLLSCAMVAAVAIEDELHYRAFKEQRHYSYSKALRAAIASPARRRPALYSMRWSRHFTTGGRRAGTA